MSKNLIDRLRGLANSSSLAIAPALLLEAADALEAKAAPVGEPTVEMVQAACAAFRMDISPIKAMHDALKAALQACAAYQRAQQPQSAEAVAYVLTRDGEVCYEADDGIVISNTPGDETDLYKWQPVYFTAPQPSAGVVMPERKTAADFDFYIDSFAAEAAEIHNRVIDEFARLNGKEVV